MTFASAPASIPHRPPFLFVDEVVELTPERILARKQADASADFFRGHFPGNPIMPGVLICESAFQAGAILMLHRAGVASAAGRVPVLTRIREAKFKHIVRPGQWLEIEVVLDDELSGACYMTGRVHVAGRLVARVSFACTLAPPTAEEDAG